MYFSITFIFILYFLLKFVFIRIFIKANKISVCVIYSRIGTSSPFTLKKQQQENKKYIEISMGFIQNDYTSLPFQYVTPKIPFHENNIPFTLTDS